MELTENQILDFQLKYKNNPEVLELLNTADQTFSDKIDDLETDVSNLQDELDDREGELENLQETVESYLDDLDKIIEKEEYAGCTKELLNWIIDLRKEI